MRGLNILVEITWRFSLLYVSKSRKNFSGILIFSSVAFNGCMTERMVSKRCTQNMVSFSVSSLVSVCSGPLDCFLLVSPRWKALLDMNDSLLFSGSLRRFFWYKVIVRYVLKRFCPCHQFGLRKLWLDLPMFLWQTKIVDDFYARYHGSFGLICIFFKEVCSICFCSEDCKICCM